LELEIWDLELVWDLEFEILNFRPPAGVSRHDPGVY